MSGTDHMADSPKARFEYTTGLIVGVALILLVTLAGIYWVLKDSFISLMTFPSREEVALVTEELNRHGIEYRLSDDQLTVLVVKESLSVGQSIVAELGFVQGSVIGLEIFESSDFGITDFAQRVNYKRALEGEITRTISSLAEVRHARVHLVLPERNLLLQNEALTTASVTIFPKPGTQLSWSQIDGIQEMVSRAVPSLQKANITITDQNGNVLTENESGTGLQSSGRQPKQAMEQELRVRLQELLAAQFIDTPIAISVDVSLSRDTFSRVSELPVGVDDSTGAMTQRRSVVQTSTDGTESRTEEVSYRFGTIQEQLQIAPGSIARITAAVFIGTEVPQERLAQVRDLAAAAIGLDSSRGDSLVVLSGTHTAASIVSSGIELQELQTELPAIDATLASTSMNAEQPSPERTWHLWFFLGSAISVLIAILASVAYWRERNKGKLSKQELNELLAVVTSSLDKNNARGSGSAS